jgi:ATP-dependent exoDNAse (exonuclease V) beta subunit
VHACLAEVEWADTPVPDSRLAAAISEVLRGQGQDDQPAAWLAEFQRLMASPWLQGQLCRQAYLQPESLGFRPDVAREIQQRRVQFTVETECPFAVLEPDGLLSGSIDRLVVLLDGDEVVAADLIDFKTDALKAGEEAIRDRTAYYRPQVEAYRRAAAQLFRLPPQRIASRLLFLDAQRAVVVD